MIQINVVRGSSNTVTLMGTSMIVRTKHLLMLAVKEIYTVQFQVAGFSMYFLVFLHNYRIDDWGFWVYDFHTLDDIRLNGDDTITWGVVADDPDQSNI